MATTTQRGYGSAHQRERERWQPTIAAGAGWCTELVCLMPTRAIQPNESWDLAHDRTHPGGYLGPAHPRCNRSEGGKHGGQANVKRWQL